MSNIESKIQIIMTAGTKVNDSTFPTFQKLLLSDLYSLVYDRCGSADALATAISNLTQAIGLNEEQTREEFPDRYEDLYYLYDASYELSGSLQTLDCAIEALRTYLEAIRERNRKVASAVGLNNLAAALLERTHHKRNTDTGSATIVCEAEALALEAFEILRQYDDRHVVENARGEMLTNLGNVCQRKFELLGNMEDLDAMAHYHKESLQKPTDPNQRATRLSNLGLAYKMRYVQTLELADLEMGIGLATQAAETKKVSKDIKSLCLQGLAELYKQQCIRLPHSRHHLDLAIRLSKVALGSAQNASRILFCRETLLNLLGLRFDRYGETHDSKATLMLAWRSYSQCMREFKTEEASSQLSVIGNVYARRSDDSDKIWNLTMAIKFHKFALKLSQALSVDIPLVNLAVAYMKRHNNLTSPDDLPRAIQIFEVVARLPNRRLSIRLQCTRSAARLSMHVEDWGNATRLWLQLIGHLPIVTTKFKSHTDMQHVLGLLSGVADWAASAFIEDGKMTPTEILAIVEGSRGQIARAVIESRGPILVDKLESPLQNLITADMSQERIGDDHIPWVSLAS
jgi:tetratricopeptide (TPR) repeat protein